MTISGRPLLVIGQFGKGTTVAFTGFTPAYTEKKSSWHATITLRYFLDQEFVTDPVNQVLLCPLHEDDCCCQWGEARDGI